MAEKWDRFEKFFANRNVKNNAFHLIPHLKPNSKMIDVGCGIGTITMDFARRVPEGSVLGVDYKSIATAKAAAAKAGITNVEFRVVDVDSLGQFPDASFDIAHCHQVLIHLINPVDTLRHMRRIVKAGGVVGTRDHIASNFCGASTLMRENLDKFWRDTRERGAKGEGAGLVNYQWMHEAGFAWDDIEKGVSGFEYSREELEAVVYGQVGFAKLRGESEEYIKKLEKDCDAYVARMESRDTAIDGWVVGTKK